MRITFVLPHAGMSGGIRVAAIHAHALARRGHSVFVVSQPYPTPDWRRRIRAWVRGRSPVPAGAHRSHLDGVDVPHRVLERPRPVTDLDVPDADVVVATWWETAEWVAKLSPRKGARAYLIQGNEVAVTPQHTDRVRATWRLPFHKITVARWLAELAAREFGDRVVSLVTNAVDHVQFRVDPRGKQERPTFGFMFSTARLKGNDIILRAVEQAAARIPRMRVISFGIPERLQPEVPRWIEYTSMPPQDQIPHLYAMCDAWLFGSRDEGFGLPILEAMACRTPVIATPAGAAPELMAAGGGTLVGAEDWSGMAAEMERIATLSDPAWRVMSDRAYAAASRFRWDESSLAFEGALEQAIERARRGEIEGRPLDAGAE